MTSSANLSTLLTRFFTQRLVQQRHASPHTIRSYRDSFHLLLLFAKSKLGKEPSQLTVDQIDAPLVSSFLDELQKSTRHWSPQPEPSIDGNSFILPLRRL